MRNLITSRFWRLLTFPVRVIEARIGPVRYAHRIDVRIRGKLPICGSSKEMISSELLDFDLAASTHIGANTFIGTGALNLKGVTIGPNSVEGANSVATKSFHYGSINGWYPPRLNKRTESYLKAP